MDIANLRVNIGRRQRFWRGTEDILKALYISHGNEQPTAID
jgi:hypothetical protein